jgi:hypothetical protein
MREKKKSMELLS